MTAYQQALDYLYSFIDFSLQKTFRMSPERFDLARMHRLLAMMGNPHQQYPTIHVAGTKGKGSVSALCASALQEAGYRTGLYTSPHLFEYTERIQVNRQQIPEADFVALVDEIKPFVAQVEQLTTFEISTALAFMYFAKQNVNAAVIEVGLGGRLDATNVVSPVVSVITSISYDHSEILGDTLAKIAFEKAGIIKGNTPLVIAPQREEVRRVIRRVAEERGAPLHEVGKDWFFAPFAHSLESQTMLVWSAKEQDLVTAYIESTGAQPWEPTRLNLPLLGYHQVQNAATAYAALQYFRSSTRPLPEIAIQEGFRKTEWEGRFEVLQRYPPVVIDAAHNRDSALRLSMALGDYFPGQPVVLVFGASTDKDVAGMFAELMPRVRQVIATQSVHPRAADPQELVRLAHQFGKPAKAVLPVEAALKEAMSIAAGEAVVLATGSVFLAAGVRQTWLKGEQNGGKKK